MERLLLPRLKILGWILVTFGCVAFVYSLILLPGNDAQERIGNTKSLEIDTFEASGPVLTPAPQLDPEILYLGVAMFWLIGTSCVIFACRRSKQQDD